MTKQLLVMGLIILVVLGIGVILFKTSNSPQTASAGLLVRSDSDMTGSPNAKVTLVEFGDYECPFCGALHPTIKQILANYQGNPNFNFVFRNFPLSQHQFAQLAAEAAEAAGAQGKFWEMHNQIYENQNAWTSVSQPLDIFVSYAKSLGLNVDQFTQDVENNKYQSKINEDLADGNALGVDATPTLYLNGQQLTANDYASLKKAIDAALAK